MALFSAAIRIDSVYLLRFPFLSHFQVFACVFRLTLEISIQFFPFHFYFLIIVALWIFVFFCVVSGYSLLM